MGNLGTPKPLANLKVTKRERTPQEKCLHSQSDPKPAKVSSAILWCVYAFSIVNLYVLYFYVFQCYGPYSFSF